MKTRHGCLTGLLAVGLLGAWATWTAGDDDDEVEGARLAVALACGLVVVYVGSAIEYLMTRPPKEQRGFPVEPRRPDGEA